MKKTTFFVLVALLTLASGIAQAIPAYRGKLCYKQPDGTSVYYYLRGDEYCHARYSEDGYMLDENSRGALCYTRIDEKGKSIVSDVQAHDISARTAIETTKLKDFNKVDFAAYYNVKNPSAAKSAVMRAPAAGATPTKGDTRGIILLVEFQDQSFGEGHTRAEFQSEMNDSAYSNNGGTGSARDYFKSQSMGKYRPSFDVYGPIKVSESESYYGNNDDANTPYMIIDACQYAHDSLGVDFSKYDNDGDGKVDYVYVIYAGYGQNYGAPSYTIWPHAYTLANSHLSLSLDGKKIDSYACSCEERGITGNQLEGIGTFCHEFGHVLGLPDFYDVDNSSDTQWGSWDIMDMGCYNNENRTPVSYSAFERYSMGWLEYTDINKPDTGMVLKELTENNCAYRLTTSKEKEYFLLENRQQKGWDKYTGGTGMMVTHVDYSDNSWTTNKVNTDSKHPLYDLVEADGSQGTRLAGDLFPGNTNNTSLTDETTPNLKSWDGVATNKSISNIREVDGNVVFDFMQDILKAPMVFKAADVTDSSFTARWSRVDNAESYKLHVIENVADTLKPVLMEENFEKMIAGSYISPDNENISSTLDKFTSVAGWSGTNVYQAGGYAKIGGYGVGGTLTTPSVDLSHHADRFTVAINGRAYTGKTVTVNVSIVDATTNAVLSSQATKFHATYKTAALTFERGSYSNAKISIESKSERLYIDGVRLLRDSISADTAFAIGIPQKDYTGITDTMFTVTGVSKGTEYLYNVYAVSSNALHNSSSSDTISVTPGKSDEEAVDRIKCDFEHGIPDNFTLVDNDGNEPSSGAKKLGFEKGKAWIDYYNEKESNHAALSTSWYKTAATSDDWMILPALNVKHGAALTWISKASDKSYADGYSVYVSVNGKELTAFDKSNPLFSVAADTAGWKSHAVDLSKFEGKTIHIAFVNNSTDKSTLYIDNIFAGVTHQVAVTMDMPYVVRPIDTVRVSGIISTEMAESIKGVDVSYSLNGTVQTLSYPDMTLEPGKTYRVTFPEPIKVEGDNDYAVTMTASHDGNSDKATEIVRCRNRKIVAEEFTGVWCGYCIRGIVMLKNMRANYPDEFVGIALHSTSSSWHDYMQVDDYLNPMLSRFNISGYPNSIVNRDVAYLGDPSNIESEFLEARKESMTGGIDVTATLDENKKNVTANTTVYFNSDNEKANYRLAYVLKEDSVHHPDNIYYSQHNYYAGGSLGVMGGYESKPSTIPAADMYYMDVARCIAGGIYGVEGSVPTSITAGKGYAYSYSFAIPDSVDNLAQTSLVVMLINSNTSKIVNAQEVRLVKGETTGVHAVTNADDSNAAVTYYDLSGRAIAKPTTRGIYIMRMNNGGVITSRKYFVH
jgi:M6 family metalloprotease-like protein